MHTLTGENWWSLALTTAIKTDKPITTTTVQLQFAVDQ